MSFERLRFRLLNECAQIEQWLRTLEERFEVFEQLE
jgi:hypothetical protein